MGKFLDLAVALFDMRLQFPNLMDRTPIQIDPTVLDSDDDGDRQNHAAQNDQGTFGK